MENCRKKGSDWKDEQRPTFAVGALFEAFIDTQGGNVEAPVPTFLLGTFQLSDYMDVLLDAFLEKCAS